MPTTTIPVHVKWSGKKFDDIPLNLDEPALQFKMQLFSLTGVEPERQKIMAKGGMLKDDTDMKTLQLKAGHTFMMMGTPGEQALKEPQEKPKFIEDMSVSEANVVASIPAGLTNMGNTCYMNSTIQCLRAIPELESALANYPKQFTQDGNANLTVALRELMKLLAKSGDAVPPLVFLQSLRAVYPQFAQVQAGHYMQQDAEECFSNLVSTLDQQLVPSGADTSFVSKFMCGTYATTMKCDEAPEEEAAHNTEKFYRVHCHISNNVNFLAQGLKEAMSEKIEKNSPTLGRSAVYTKSSLISRLPQFLTVGFVRFFWKQEQQVKAKIMRAVKFPLDLDMVEFCTPELQQKMAPARELLKKQTEAREENTKRRKLAANASSSSAVAATSSDSWMDGVAKKESIQDQMDKDLWNDAGANMTGMYELSAVLTHVGRSADAGHYMAWTRKEEGSDEWWKFDDDKVSPVKSEDILKLFGGGDWHMAYLLLYRAKKLL